MSLAQRALAGVFATAMAVSPSFAQNAKSNAASEPVKIAQSFRPVASIYPKPPYEPVGADAKAQDYSMENNGRKGVGISLFVGAAVDPAKLEELKSLITGNLKDEGAPSQIFVGRLNSPKGATISAFINGDRYIDPSDGQMIFNTRGFGLNIHEIAMKFKAVLAKPEPTISSLHND